jgi:ribonuclease R
MKSELNKHTLLAFIAQSGGANKKDIADAFGIKGDVRIALKDLLHALEDGGQIIKVGGQRYTVPAGLPATAPLRITSVTIDGDIWGEPAEWDTDRQGPRPKIMIEADAKEHASLQENDVILARIKASDESGPASGKMIRRLDQATETVIGEVIQVKAGRALRTLAKRNADVFMLEDNAIETTPLHHLVQAQLITRPGADQPVARITTVIGAANDPRVISLVAAHEVGLRTVFPDAVIKQAENLPRPHLYDGLVDLRKFSLVTIDGEDARDFDDAVFAEPDDNPENTGGFHLLVAIADVSHYVRAGTALDDEAYKRGNSTYFPDRVLPMLPEGLSNDLCSLKPKEDRYCLAVHMWIDKSGVMVRHKFCRGLMKSIARLTYTQVQNAYDGKPDAITEPLLRPIIFPLYEAFKLLQKARAKRGTLELEVPERKIVVDDTGAMAGVTLRERFASHQLIEEFMILANVAAALALQQKKAPCVYRVHDQPSFEKIHNLRTYLATFGVDVPKGDVSEPDQLATILRSVKGKPYAQLISESMLRSQMQAHYSTDNIGHFGLALNHYAHFTSPIRRYADLLVHRSLIRAYGFGEGGLDDETRIRLPSMCDHISITERASMEAERNTVDRFTAAFMADKIGQTFEATINSVTRFGLFVRLKDSGADGLIPMRMLDGDFFVHDERLHAMVGRRTGMVYRLGAPIMVELIEAAPLAGALMFRPAQDTGADIPGYELSIDPETYRPPAPPPGKFGPRGGGGGGGFGRGGDRKGGGPRGGGGGRRDDRKDHRRGGKPPPSRRR